MTRTTDFAEGFLLDLSRLELAEIPIGVRVARECIRTRASVACNKTAYWSLLEAEEVTTAWREAPRLAEVMAEQSKECFEFGGS